MTQPLRICLVKKKMDSDTVVGCLESIQFEHKKEIFRFPEEFQPLENHPVIAEQSKVIKILGTMKEVNLYRYMRIHLSEGHRPLYIDEDENFKFAGQLLEKLPDRSSVISRGPGVEMSVQKVACSVGDTSCTFEGTLSSSDRHLESRLSLLSALVSKQQSEVEKLKTVISRQQAESLRQKKEIERQTAEISGLEKKNLEQNRKISEQEARILDQQTEILEKGTRISSLRRKTPNSTHEPRVHFIWKISNYADQLAKAKSGEIVELHSKPFFTSKNGYKLRAGAFLDGYGDGKNTHLSIFIQLLPGGFDSLLRWPFTREVFFTLMDQAENPDEAHHKTKSFIPEPTRKAFQRPQKDCPNPGKGYHLVSHETLGTRHYVKDDTIFIMIEIG